MAKQRKTEVMDASFLESAPLRASATRRVEATATATFNCVADVHSWRKWARARCEWTSPPPYGVGSTRTFYRRKAGTNGTQVVTAFEPGRRIAFAQVDTRHFGVKAHYEEYTFVDTGDGSCDVTLRFGQQLNAALVLFELSQRAALAIFGGSALKLILGRLSRYIDENEGRFLPPPNAQR